MGLVQEDGAEDQGTVYRREALVEEGVVEASNINSY